MEEFSISAENVIETAWLKTKSIAVGQVPPVSGTPALFVLIEKDGVPYLRVDLYADSEQIICFQETIIWKSWAIVGYGNYIHFVSTANGAAKSIELDDYFGHLYPYDDFLLAASGTSLFKISDRADIIWKSPDLGIDGVLVKTISNNVIFGEGEWDPPGGWRSFQISCSTGLEVY